MADYLQMMQMKQTQAKLCEPLYDAIEESDFKRGIKLANSSKLRSIPLAQALKAYCLACNKEMSAALDAARECMAAFPTEEGTLNAVQHTLRICYKEEELGPFYEALLVKYPGSPGILSLMFNFYVRMGDGKKMQNTAQKLYKVTNDSKFQFWSVASMLQQTGLPPMMLTIAEKTIAKLFFPPSGDSSKVESSSDLAQPGSEEIEVYLEVLLRQGKVEQALSSLDALYSRPTGLGKGITDDEHFKENSNIVKMHEMRYRSLKIDLCTKLVLSSSSLEAGRVADLIATIKSEHEVLLESYPDQWHSHQQLAYIAATGSLVEQQQGSHGQGLSCSHDTAGALVTHRASLKQLSSKHPSLRGPYLAEILLLVLWINTNAGSDGALPEGWDSTVGLPRDFSSSLVARTEKETKGVALGALVGLVCSFVDRFQSKQCCFGDVKSNIDFIASMGETGLAWLAAVSQWAAKRAQETEKDVKNHIADAPSTKKGKGKGKGEGKGTKEASGREECINMVCSAAVMGQVSVYTRHHTQKQDEGEGEEEAGALEVDGDAEDVARLQLHLMTKAYCVGGVGGEKEVQPADEVLLLSSPWRRQAHSHMAAGITISIDGDAVAADAMMARGKCDVANVSWAIMMSAGKSASPYSHAFALEAMEPVRNLAAGKHCLALFEGLGVKHVQNDSMSYIVLPALLETGMVKEAHRQHIQVCNFHMKAGKDTGEMIGKSFEHSNYAKGLEMKRFHFLCQSSLQLALSKAELPLIELMENGNYFEVEAAAHYLEGCVEGTPAGGERDAPLFMDFIDDEGMAALCDNCDYGVLVRCDSTVEEERLFAYRRRREAEHRIRESQLTLQLLSATLNAEPRKATEKLDQLQTFMEEQRGIPIACLEDRQYDWSSDAGIAAAGRELIRTIAVKAAYIIPTSERNGNGGGKAIDEIRMPFSQGIRTGPRTSTICIHTAIHACFRFSTACAATLETILALDPNSSGQEDIIEKGQAKAKDVNRLAGSFIVSMRALQDCITAEETLYDSVETKGDQKGNSGKVVSPTGIHFMSMFTRTLGRWMPLILKAGLKSFPEDTSALDVPAADPSNVEAMYRNLLSAVGKDVRAVADKGRDLIQGVRTAIRDMETNVKGFHRLRPHLLFESSNFAQAVERIRADAGADNVKEAADLIESCRVALSKEISESQALSCSRLLAYLDISVQMLG